MEAEKQVECASFNLNANLRLLTTVHSEPLWLHILTLYLSPHILNQKNLLIQMRLLMFFLKMKDYIKALMLDVNPLIFLLKSLK